MFGFFKKIKNKITEINSDLGIDERNQELFAVSALFDTPDDIIKAAKTLSSSGFRKYDIHTPYPVHGMDDSMKLKPSKLGFFTFFFGSLGTLTAIAMIFYMAGFDYKNIIGGKPFFSLPPSIPVTFELTILLAGAFTVFLVLILFNKLPLNNNPLLDTEYMKRVSSDKFGAIVEADDELFNKDEIIRLFKSLGSSEVNLIYKFKHNELTTERPIFDFKFITLLFLLALITAAVTYFSLNKLIYLPPFNWMSEQFKVKPQTQSTFFEDGYSMRNPIEGSIPRNELPYEYRGLPDSLVKYMSNPLPVSKEVFEKGKTMYDIYCSPCHGYYGKGDSRLNGQFPNPPSLHTDRARLMKDAAIYHIITTGQNIMPAYDKQIPQLNRWAIVHYIRALQRSQNANDGDMNK